MQFGKKGKDTGKKKLLHKKRLVFACDRNEDKREDADKFYVVSDSFH